MVQAASPEPTADAGQPVPPAIAVALTPTRAIALAVAVVLVVLASIAIGRVTAPTSAPPSTTSAEAGFARDMQEHHNQAVEMALIVRDRTDDPDTRLLAYDIATSQAQQSGQMFGWLAEWGLPQAPAEPSMTWMLRPPLNGSDHEGSDQGSGEHGSAAGSAESPSHTPGSPMPGMATRDQLLALEGLDGRDAELLFLELMILHHQGGVAMAQAVLDRSDRRVVRDLAASILSVQQSEIELMEQMIAERS